MSYRDDRDADRARIAALETELAVANQKLAEALGKRSEALVHAGGNALIAAGSVQGKLPWYGAPMRLELTRTFEGEYPREKLEDLIELIRRETRDAGRSELFRSSLTWTSGTNAKSTGPFLVASVSVREGKTSLMVSDALGQLAGGIYGGIGGGVGAGAVVAPILALMSMPWLIPVGVAGWLGAVFLGSRSIFRRAARRRAEVVQALFVALSVEIAAKIPPSTTP